VDQQTLRAIVAAILLPSVGQCRRLAVTHPHCVEDAINLADTLLGRVAETSAAASFLGSLDAGAPTPVPAPLAGMGPPAARQPPYEARASHHGSNVYDVVRTSDGAVMSGLHSLPLDAAQEAVDRMNEAVAAEVAG
jgi:hypothetical protein